MLGVVSGARVFSESPSATSGGRRHQRELRQTDESDPEDLAGEQLGGPEAREQHLDHPAGLLLHHADEQEASVEGDGHEQQHQADRGQRDPRRAFLRGRLQARRAKVEGLEQPRRLLGGEAELGDRLLLAPGLAPPRSRWPGAGRRPPPSRPAPSDPPATPTRRPSAARPGRRSRRRTRASSRTDRAGRRRREGALGSCDELAPTRPTVRVGFTPPPYISGTTTRATTIRTEMRVEIRNARERARWFHSRRATSHRRRHRRSCAPSLRHGLEEQVRERGRLEAERRDLAGPTRAR